MNIECHSECVPEGQRSAHQFPAVTSARHWCERGAAQVSSPGQCAGQVLQVLKACDR